MSLLKRSIAVGVFAASLVGGAGASTFSQLVVFGDSLSDAGNAAAITSNSFPPSPPYAGPASNGPTAAQYMAQRYGVSVGLGWPVATATSNNYAVLGGLNGEGNYNVQIGRPKDLGTAFPLMASTGISQQIARYQSVNPLVPNPGSTLFMVWGGANDAFLAVESPGADAGTIGQAMNKAVLDLAGNIQQLALMGATRILVPSMPDLGLTPEAILAGPFAQGVLSSVSQGYNDGIDQMLASLGAQLAPWGVKLYPFDTPGFFDDMTNSPAFTNTTQSCLFQGDMDAVMGGCKGYLYFDNVHPTTAAHSLLADAFMAAVPEPQTWALMLMGLVALFALARRRRSGGPG